MYISPQAVITDQAEDVILYRSDEPGTDLFINDIAGQLFYKTAEFNSSGFTVILPPAVVTLEGYARELLNKYKQPGFTYTIIYQ
jgi:hypothetical protein